MYNEYNVAIIICLLWIFKLVLIMKEIHVSINDNNRHSFCENLFHFRIDNQINWNFDEKKKK